MAHADQLISERSARPAASEHATFYAGYVARVPAGDIVRVLDSQITVSAALLRSVPDERTTAGYAPGKWSIRDVVQHLADAERIMSYRALRFARGDGTPLPGFEENDYAPVAQANAHPMHTLVSELESVRRATVSLFEGLPADAWRRSGNANGNEISVRALASVIAGHELHHLAIVRERYLAN